MSNKRVCELEDNIIATVKAEMGYPVVDIYITDDQIKLLINKSIRKCSVKSSPRRLANKTISGGKIDVSDLEIEVVSHIYEGVDGGSIGTGDVFEDYMVHARSGLSQTGGSGHGFYNALAHIGSISELKKLMLYDYHYDSEEKVIYVDNYRGSVTIEYVVGNPTIADLSKQWLAWVEGYTTALVKIAEGRIRGKYRVSGAPFEISADDLVSEGQSEKSELDQKLDMSMGYYNVLRG